MLGWSSVPFSKIWRAQTTALGYANDQTFTSSSDPASVVGQILNGQYMIDSNIPVASKKCKIYEAYRINDPQRKPVIIKLSPIIDRIHIEYKNYEAIAHRLGPNSRNLFVDIYDWIVPSPLTHGCAGIIMEKGEDNLRFDIMTHGRYRGDKLRNAMESVLRIVNSLHEENIMWTEIKAENFVVQDGGFTIKGIDLESAIGQDALLAMYTAEACPPEFPVDDMYKCLPKIQMEPSFDMWGVGMTLLELATGKPFFADGLTDLEYIKDTLRNKEVVTRSIDEKLMDVDPEVRHIIKSCLAINPRARSSCKDLLKSPYFTKRASQTERLQA